MGNWLTAWFVCHSEKRHRRMEVDVSVSPHENRTENFVSENINDRTVYFLMYEISKWNSSLLW